MSLPEFWLLSNGMCDIPKCTCKTTCDSHVRFISWNKGFANFAKGHYSTEKRRIASKTSMLGSSHWSRGRSKNNDIRLLESSLKSSLTLRKGFASGRIKHWSSGKTKLTESRIARAVIVKKLRYQSHKHPHFMNTDDVIARITSSFSGKFTVIDVDFRQLLEQRKNNREHILNIECLRCNKIFSRSVYGIIRSQMKCNSCDANSSSIAEAEIYEFISSLGFVAEKRTKLLTHELDIYVPAMKFAVEFNGLYWHSEAVNQDKLYHSNKTNVCENQGIHLLHVFEDEWRDKRSIVESMIRARLNSVLDRIDARKCKPRKMTLSERRDFFKENHIDGDVASSDAYCLVDKNDTPVFAISLRIPRNRKYQNELELARVAGKLNCFVRGAFGKLFTYVRKQHRTSHFMTYVDKRHGGIGVQYVKSGFKHVKYTSPRFWWTDTVNRYDRFTVKADGDVSEFDVSILRRRLKLWGVVNIVLRYTCEDTKV